MRCAHSLRTHVRVSGRGGTQSRACEHQYRYMCHFTLTKRPTNQRLKSHIIHLYGYAQNLKRLRSCTHWRDARARQRARAFQNRSRSLCRGSALFKAHMWACESCLQFEIVMSAIWISDFSRVTRSCLVPRQSAWWGSFTEILSFFWAYQFFKWDSFLICVYMNTR